MTKQNIPDVTVAEQRLARQWAKSVEANRDTWNYNIRAAARVILNAACVPTMADMTEEERHECRWMQCDADPYGRRGLIVKVKDWSVYVVDKETGVYSNYSPDLVTARPDLHRFEWSDTEKVEDENTVEIGDVIESAADPRIDALPDGSILIDRDGAATFKRGERDWSGAGYRPILSEGDEFGPWTVERIGQENRQ